MSSFLGKNIGHYELQEEVSYDNFARVYKGFDTRLERPILVKIAEMEPEFRQGLVPRFQREAKFLAALNHPNIVKIFDYGEHHRLPYLVLEYVSGTTLQQQFGKLIMWQDAAKLLSPIAHALEYAHQNHVIHWNVRLSSILITHTGKPMLSDFGISWLLRTDEVVDIDDSVYYFDPSMPPEAAKLFTKKMSAGGRVTDPSMSPKAAKGESQDLRGDIYSLGIVFYQLITGRLPFDVETPIGFLLQQIQEGKTHNPREFVPDLPIDVEDVLSKSIATNPADRFQSMKEFATMLDYLANNMSIRSIKAFLCHSSGDKVTARELYKQLVNNGINVWFDEENLLPGQEWDIEIRKAVRASDAVIVCLSKSSVSKEGYVQKEIRYALDIADEKPEGSIYIIPVRLENCEPPHRLNKWHWVDVFVEGGFEKLLKALKKRKSEIDTQILDR